MKIINNIFMIVILYSILIFFDKTSEKKEFNKNNKNFGGKYVRRKIIKENKNY